MLRRASRSKSTPATARRAAHFAELVQAQAADLKRTLHRNNIDTISLQTGNDYLPGLRSFFKARERRMAVR